MLLGVLERQNLQIATLTHFIFVSTNGELVNANNLLQLQWTKVIFINRSRQTVSAHPHK